MTSFSQFSLLCVHYIENDFKSFILSISSLTPYIILYTLSVLIIFQRHFQDIIILLGLGYNEFTNQILKRIIRESRPERTIWKEIFHPNSISNDYYDNTFGMPSSHAQFMSFFLLVGIPYYTDMFNSHKKDKFHQVLRVLMITIGGAICILVGLGRVHQEYHSLLQILIGFSVGIVNGCIWRGFIWNKLKRILSKNKILRYELMFRDTELVEDIRKWDSKHYIDRIEKVK